MNPVLEKFAEWLTLSDEEKTDKGFPLTQREFSFIHKVSEPQLSIWKKGLEKQGKLTHNEIQDFLDMVWKGVQAGKNPMWARLWWEIHNPDKKELRQTDFSADEYINIGNRVIERLREQIKEGGGICPVCLQPQILSEDVCVDNQSQHGESS